MPLPWDRATSASWASAMVAFGCSEQVRGVGVPWRCRVQQGEMSHPVTQIPAVVEPPESCCCQQRAQGCPRSSAGRCSIVLPGSDPPRGGQAMHPQSSQQKLQDLVENW